MRVVLTAVEKLDGEFPGLIRDMEDLFRRGVLQERIQSLLRRKYQVVVPLPQISKYRVKRWIPKVRRVRDRAEHIEAFIEVAMRSGRRLAKGRRYWRRDERPKIVMTLAADLFGPDWQEALRSRLLERFHVSEPTDLTPAQARSEIEALISRLALARSENSKLVKGLISERVHGTRHE